MMINLLHLSSWVLIAAGIVIAIVVLRFFSHLLHFVFRFFWHGCATGIVLLAVYFILRTFHIL